MIFFKYFHMAPVYCPGFGTIKQAGKTYSVVDFNSGSKFLASGNTLDRKHPKDAEALATLFSISLSRLQSAAGNFPSI